MAGRNGRPSQGHRGHPVRAPAQRRGRQEPVPAADGEVGPGVLQLPVTMDPTACWIAAGLGVPRAQLSRVKAGTEAGQDEGRLFYRCEPVAGVTLLVRHDGLRAYATLDRQLPVEVISRVVRDCGMQIEDTAAMSLAMHGPDADWRRWARVADGVPPRPATCQSIEFPRIGHAAPARAAELAAVTARLYEELPAIGRGRESVSVHAVAVCPGELVAREQATSLGRYGRDVFGREIPPPVKSRERRLVAGPGVRRTHDGEYVATDHGYLTLADGTLSVLSPLWVDENWMRVWWMILDSRPLDLEPETVRRWLTDLGVRQGILEEKIAALCWGLAAGRQRQGVYPIAKGIPATDGTDAVIEILVDAQRCPGELHSDGSIDFRRVNFAPNVVAGQHLATRHPPGAGTPGVDVRGRELPAAAGTDQPLCAGDNVRVASSQGRQEFHATADGVFRYRDGRIAVVECLAIKGDVDFDTGNLDFDGEIFIDGSVVQGFSVVAGSDLTVSGTVEPGATLSSGADITIGRGIVGRKTRVAARGRIRAQFTQEASLTADGDILLENSAHHARLRAGGSVKVSMSSGRHGGSIVGGETWARECIRSCIAGAHAGTKTLLVTGLDGSSARELDKLTRTIEVISEHMQSALERFGIDSIDVSHIRSMIRAATGPRRKLLAHQAHQLGKLVQMYQTALQQRTEVRGRFSRSLDTAQISVTQTAYAGVTIRIGDQKRTLLDDLHHVKFRLRDGDLVQEDALD